MKIKTIIIDDEPNARLVLRTLLTNYIQDIEIVAEAASAAEGLALLETLSIDAVFLDIEMPKMDGLALLRQLKQINFEIVFVTAYNQYAIEAIKFSALDYLLKPVDIDELKATIQRLKQKLSKSADQQNQSVYFLPRDFNNLQHQHSKIALPTAKGFRITQISDIQYAEAARNYTTFFLENGQKIVVGRNLKFFETKLQGFGFFRSHESYLINLSKVEQYEKGKVGRIILDDGNALPVSRGRKAAMLKLLT